MGINIIGTGNYLPSREVSNDELAQLVDTSDEWIVTRTGIKKRRVSDGELTYEMGANAANVAIKNANIDPMSIDIIIVSTVTADYITPSTACLIANSIGALNASVCMDVNCACAGFVYALDMAKKYLSDDEYKTALVVSTEMLSKITDYSDRATCILFGDGAGACVITESDKLYASVQGSDPTGVSKLFGRGIEPSNPFMTKTFDRLGDGLPETKGHALYQDGKEVYKFATRAMPKAIKLACEKAKINPEDLSLVISHQANLRILETAAKNLHLPMEKVFVNIHKYGNSSSACIPICIAEAVAEERLNRGDKFCIVGFGGGLVYGATVMEY